MSFDVENRDAQNGHVSGAQAEFVQSLRELGANIRDNKMLKAVIRRTPAINRKVMYNAVLPYLAFKPLPYYLVTK
jgi:hypothetical protein